MNTSKVLTGVKFFDDRYGGVYAGRCWVVSGPSGSGKSAIGLQFLMQGISQAERCLLLSVQRAADEVLWAASHGPGIEKAIESGALTVLEYGDFVPGRDKELDPNLPPEGFLDLQHIVAARAIQRVVLDTVVPWAMTRQPETLGERVYSLVRAFDRLNCTTLLTLPRPVSPRAAQLKEALETVVPIAAELSLSHENGQRSWLTTKYLGDASRASAVAYAIAPGRGAQAGRGALTGEAGEERSPGRARFASAVFGRESHATRAPDRTARFGMTMTR